MNSITTSQSGQSFFEVAPKLRAAMMGVLGDGAGVGEAQPARPADASLLRLESLPSNLKLEDHVVGFHAVVPWKCRCRTCEKCGPKTGWCIRQVMLSKADFFIKPRMLTLTVDRSKFESSEQAHRTITEGSYIARLMRLLGIKTWFWVLEFQTKSGDGWPHWHVLIDLDDCGGFIDLHRVWHLWRDKWKLGGLDLGKAPKFADSHHAVWYITKYLTKSPEAYPVWVLKSNRTVRFVGGCKAIGSLTGQPSRDRAESEPDDQLKLFREPRTPFYVRMARCGMSATVFCVDGNCVTGEGGWTWASTIQCKPDDLVEMAEQGLVSLRVAAVEWGTSELIAITSASIGGYFAAMKKLPDELADRDVGYADEWCESIAGREISIIEKHDAFWKARAA